MLRSIIMIYTYILMYELMILVNEASVVRKISSYKTYNTKSRKIKRNN